jgi:oligosaccharide translocation protein RFT1
MALFSMIFVVVTGGFYSFGFQDLSLIYANIVNLSVRIVYASVFVASYFTTRGARDVLRWRKMAVSTSTCLAIAATAIISRYTVRNSDVQRVLKTGRGFAILNSAVLSHVTIDAVLGLLCLGMWWRQSGRYLSLPRNR